jgi:hypothetical protein
VDPDAALVQLVALKWLLHAALVVQHLLLAAVQAVALKSLLAIHAALQAAALKALAVHLAHPSFRLFEASRASCAD